MAGAAIAVNYEVELKFPNPAGSALRTALESLNPSAAAFESHIDQYFNHPVRDFALTDEALRIRSIGGENRLTFKGPKVDATSKTRKELEIRLASGVEPAQGLGAMLVALGFVPAGTVKKTREIVDIQWEGHQVEVAFDQVHGLGDFIELETVADEASMPAARAALLRLADRLDLKESIRLSYLQMLLARPT